MNRHEKPPVGTDSANTSPHIYQLRIRDLLVVMTCLAVLAAILAPWIRDLQKRGQLALVIELAAIFVLGTAFVVTLFFVRRRVERRAGRLRLTVNRAHARWFHGIAVVLFAVLFGFSGWRSVDQALEQSSVLPLLNPSLLMWGFLGVNYGVVKIWWRFDPLTLEVRDAGLVMGGLGFISWRRVSRYTLSGSPPNRLNLYTTEKHVANIPLATADAPLLDTLLRTYVGRRCDRQEK